jgi:hypothetical protein
VTDQLAEVNDCKYLFLAQIEELGHNCLRLVIEEGLPSGGPTSLKIADQTIPDCTRIEVTPKSRVFELVWTGYVAYSVRNESFAASDHDERYEGLLFRTYSKSHFIDYVSRSTFATADYPGPVRHYGIGCQDHVVDVISIVAPLVQRSSSEDRSIKPRTFRM